MRIARFAERMREHGAQLLEVIDRPRAVAAAVEGICDQRGIRSAVVPAALPDVVGTVPEAVADMATPR